MTEFERQPVGFSYKRFSSKRQERGDSMLRQGRLASEWSARSGVPIDDSLKLDDAGVSAFRGANRHKGALRRFLDLAQEGKKVRPGDYLIVEALDRLSRQEAIAALPIITELVEAGIRIVNLDLGSGRDQIIDRDTLRRDPLVLIVILLEFVRGHEESMKKSRRVRAWRTPRLAKARESKTPLAQRLPGWIRRLDDRFEIIPERSHVLLRAVKMALQGIGPLSIAQAFNRENVPVISGRSTTTAWHFSVIRFYLRSRLLLGEYQPTQIDENGHRVPVGDPIASYYPALLDEPTYYRLQAALDVRAKGKRQGSDGKNIANLFCRLLVNGHDGTTCYLSQKRKENINLVSALMVQGKTPVISFPYPVFERAFFQWVAEVTVAEQEPSGRLGAEIDGRVQEVTRRMEEVEALIQTSASNEFSRLAKLLAALEQQHAELVRAAEQTRRAASRPRYDTSDILQLAEQMPQLGRDELREVRSRLRLAIASVVEQIELFPAVGASSLIRHAGVIVWLRDGAARFWELRVERNRPSVTIGHGRDDLRWEADDPEHLRTLVASYVKARSLLPYRDIASDPFADTVQVTLPSHSGTKKGDG